MSGYFSLGAHMAVIIEPFRIKTVETIRQTTRAERLDLIQKAHYNPFLLKARDVLIDLLTDSGTSAMSSEQWAAIMRGDESYAGAESFLRFEKVVKDLTAMPFLLPTHQGRANEKILCTALLKAGDVVISNTLFDTTRANIEHMGAKGIDFLCEEGRHTEKVAPFKGNLHIDEASRYLEANPGKVRFCVLTVTNNGVGGQPVSMRNVEDTSQMCRRFGIPLILDACRFAENSWFIKQREAGYESWTPKQIAQKMFSFGDACSFSGKKDALTNIGGFLTFRNDAWLSRFQSLLILTEGFPTYGGLAGRDLDAMAVGLEEVLEEDYLRYRIRSIEYVVEKLTKMGVPVVQPAGGHAVFVDAAKWLNHIPKNQFPGWSASLALYIEGGIRCCEIGTVMFGKEAQLDLVRLAIPRRVYTQSHMDYVVEVFKEIHERRHKIPGCKFVKESPVMRHFTSEMAFLESYL